ncbi:WD repeat-containing protein 38 [Biomphalaria glabrata]|nr:WD repeat-containing protein 38 [Biomphalaria glabrata]
MFLTPSDFTKQTFTEFIGHKDEVNCVSYSPDFQFVVTGSDDHRVRVFNVKTKQCIIKLRGHNGAIKCVAVSQCSRYLASGSYDKSARIWKTASAECLHVLSGHHKSIESIAFSPGAVYVCTGSWDRTARLWCVQARMVLQIFHGHGSLVQSMAFSHDSHMLASGSWDFTVRVWSLNHKHYKKIRANVNQCSSEKITSDRKDNTLTKTLHLRNISETEKDNSDHQNETTSDLKENHDDKENEIEYRSLIGHTGNVHSVTFSLIGMLASGSWDRTVRLWNPWKGICLRHLVGHIGWVQAVSFSPDSTFIASAADDDYVKIWDIVSGDCVKTLEGDTDMVQFCAFTPDGEVIASGAAVVQGKQLPKRKNEEEIKDAEDQLLAMLNCD